MLSCFWDCLAAIYSYVRVDVLPPAPRETHITHPVVIEERLAATMPNRPHDPEVEPEREPWYLNQEQEAHLQQGFPNFQAQPLTTPSDEAFANWLQQGMSQ